MIKIPTGEFVFFLLFSGLFAGLAFYYIGGWRARLDLKTRYQNSLSGKYAVWDYCFTASQRFTLFCNGKKKVVEVVFRHWYAQRLSLIYAWEIEGEFAVEIANIYFPLKCSNHITELQLQRGINYLSQLLAGQEVDHEEVRYGNQKLSPPDSNLYASRALKKFSTGFSSVGSFMWATRFSTSYYINNENLLCLEVSAGWKREIIEWVLGEQGINYRCIQKSDSHGYTFYFNDIFANFEILNILAKNLQIGERPYVFNNKVFTPTG